MIFLDYQKALLKDSKQFVPSEQEVNKCLQLVITELKQEDDIELTIRIVEVDEIKQLNADYRHKNTATNVLSFPYEKIEGGGGKNYLGDIIICAEVVEKEAIEQRKKVAEHWQHMIIHSCLHLYGYDHIEHEDVEIMENLEILILKKIGIKSPYE